MKVYEQSDENQIIKLIYSLAHKCAIYGEVNFKKFGITFPQSVLLFLLAEYNDRDLCQKDIETMLGVKGSSITSLVNNTSKKGIIERKPCASDGRKYIIKITDKGYELIEKIKSGYKEIKIDLFETLTDDEKKQLLNILLKIT